MTTTIEIQRQKLDHGAWWNDGDPMVLGPVTKGKQSFRYPLSDGGQLEVEIIDIAQSGVVIGLASIELHEHGGKRPLFQSNAILRKGQNYDNPLMGELKIAPQELLTITQKTKRSPRYKPLF